MQIKLCLLFTLLLFPSCLTWWDTGHMLVANIAKLTLLKEGNRNIFNKSPQIRSRSLLSSRKAYWNSEHFLT